MTPNDISTPKKAEDATRHPLALLNIWPGDRVKVIGNTVPDEEEDYRGSLGTVSRIDPTEALPLFVIVDQADEEFGAVQFIAEELEVVTPGPISTYIAALRAQAEAEAGLREAVAQLMSDPWSYHEKGARCIDCGRLDVDGHSDDCAVVKIRVFIAQDELRHALAQAGGES